MAVDDDDALVNNALDAPPCNNTIQRFPGKLSYCAKGAKGAKGKGKGQRRKGKGQNEGHTIKGEGQRGPTFILKLVVFYGDWVILKT